MGNVEVSEPRPDLDRLRRPPRASESPRANSRAALIDAALEEFSTKGYEAATVAGFRVFTRKVAVLQIEDGKYKVLSHGFVDILKPPDLKPTDG